MHDDQLLLPDTEEMKSTMGTYLHPDGPYVDDQGHSQATHLQHEMT